MTKEEIIAKLRKIKSLAESSEGGEQINAAKLFDSLCQKYDINEQDISDTEVSAHALFIPNEYDFRLLHQLYHAHYNKNGTDFQCVKTDIKISKRDRLMLDELYGVKDWNVLISVTDADYVQLMAEYEVYRAALHKSFEAFYYAFLDSNGLLIVRDSNEEPDISSDQFRMMVEAAKYSKVIDRTHIHKQIK